MAKTKDCGWTSLNHYWIANYRDYQNLRLKQIDTVNLYNELFENYEGEFYRKEANQSIKKIRDVFNLFGDLQSDMCVNLSYIENRIGPHRSNTEITVNNEIETRTFKIFKKKWCYK